MDKLPYHIAGYGLFALSLIAAPPVSAECKGGGKPRTETQDCTTRDGKPGTLTVTTCGDEQTVSDCVPLPQIKTYSAVLKPSYFIATVAYAPPGSKGCTSASTASYGSNASVGSSVSTEDSFTSDVKIGAKVSAEEVLVPLKVSPAETADALTALLVELIPAEQAA